jgi:phenylacetate-CoA ligase
VVAPENKDVYGRVYRDALFPTWERLRGRATLAHLDELEASQWHSADEIAARQLVDLKRLLQHAFDHVPFYRARFDERELAPSDVRELSDLAKLPFLTRADIRSSAQERTSTVPPFPSIFKTTSGSSGKPITIAYDQESEVWRQSMKWRSYGWARFRPGDPVLHYWGPPQKPLPKPATRAKIAVDRKLRRELYVNCVAQSDADLEAVVQTIEDFRPSVIVSYAQAAGNLARFMNQRGLRLSRRIPIICTAEQLVPADRVELERAFGRDVFNSYGGRETMLLAMECDAHDGLHVAAENILIEVVVEENGRTRAALPGETGEVVVTDLHNFGSPLIRYTNGDLARVGTGTRCDCERGLPKLEAIEGRVTDALRDGNGGRVQGMIFPVVMLKYADAVRQYQAVQHKDRSVTVRIVPSPLFTPEVEGLMRGNLERAISGVAVKIEVVTQIPVPDSGKQRLIVIE